MHPFQNRSIMDYDFGIVQGKGDYGTKSAAALKEDVGKNTARKAGTKMQNRHGAFHYLSNDCTGYPKISACEGAQDIFKGFGPKKERKEDTL